MMSEVEQREKIAELIAVFEDRNRVEVLAVIGGGLLPCSFWRGVWPHPDTGKDWETVALCFDLVLPGTTIEKVDQRDDPLAIGLVAIEALTGTEVHTEVPDYMETSLECRLIVEMLMAVTT